MLHLDVSPFLRSSLYMTLSSLSTIRSYIYIIGVLLCSSFAVLPARGQDSNGGEADNVRPRPLLARDSLRASQSDSCDVVSSSDGCLMPGALPWLPGAYGSQFHEGFNAEVGLSVSASFGKHRRKGAGFGEHFAAAYAMPFSKDRRWMGAVGLYIDRMDWGNYHSTEAGIAGMLGYRVNDWCSLFLYGSYQFLPSQYSCGYAQPSSLWYDGSCGWWGVPYDDFYGRLKGRIGAAAQFRLGNAAAITVAVEQEFRDNSCGVFDTTHGVPGFDPTKPNAGAGGGRRVRSVDYGRAAGMPVNQK